MIKSTITFTCELQSISPLRSELGGTEQIMCRRAESHLRGYYEKEIVIIGKGLRWSLTRGSS